MSRFLNRIATWMLRKTSPMWSDVTFLKIRFRLEMGKRLDLDNPVTLNEKLQWLKLYNRRPEYTGMVDKIRVKEIVADRIGRQYIIPTLGVWERAEDVDFNSLPDKFVLKTNHSGGNSGVAICHDKSSFDREVAKAKMSRSLKDDNIYKNYREWPYKGVKPMVFAETLLESQVDPGSEIVDYKFFCFNGKVDSVMLCLDRQEGHPKFYFFDRDWQLRRYNIRGKEAPADFTLPKPENIDKMFDIAATLSQGIPFARVDLYDVDGHIYFGEITFFPASGLDPNLLPETDKYFGDLVDLSLVELNGSVD